MNVSIARLIQLLAHFMPRTLIATVPRPIQVDTKTVSSSAPDASTPFPHMTDE